MSFWVKQVDIYTIFDEVVELIGEEAERIYETCLNYQGMRKYPNLFVSFKGMPMFIPSRNIGLLVFHPDDEANEIQKKIDKKWDQVEGITGVKGTPDSLWSYNKIGHVFIKSSEESPVQKVTESMEVVRLLQEIRGLVDRLEEIRKQSNSTEEEVIPYEMA